MARKAVAGVLTAGLLALSMWLYTFKPHLQATLQNPITVNGRIGTVVSNRVFSVKVAKVEAAAALSKSDFGNPQVMPTPGLFLIVSLAIKSNRKPFQPDHVRLVTRGGVSYDQTGRTAIFSTDDTYQPMLWGPATYIFELPKDRLAGARLVVGESGLLDQLSAETSVDLGIDGARAAQLSAHPAATYAVKTI